MTTRAGLTRTNRIRKGACPVPGGLIGGGLIALAGLLNGCASPNRSDSAAAPTRTAQSAPAASPEATLDEVVALMSGTFSSEAQSQQNPEFRPIVLHMTPIWTRSSHTLGQREDRPARRGHGLETSPREGERWLYVEQALTTAAQKPYRQRVYRISPLVYTDVQGVSCVGVRSEVWELPGDPLRFAGAWQTPDLLADIRPESLSQKEGCEVVLFRAADGSWRGSTLGNACASTRQGAAYTTSIVEINAEGLRTLDRGYDAKGTQVWGSELGAYDFRRVVKD